MADAASQVVDPEVEAQAAPGQREHQMLTRLQWTLLIPKVVAMPFLAFFGLLVTFSTFGQGDVLVGIGLMLAATLGPVIHGAILTGLRRGAAWERPLAFYGSFLLMLLDGVVSGAFAIPAADRGDWWTPLLFLLLVNIHGVCALLAARLDGEAGWRSIEDLVA